jgi:hypothetical protein
VNHFFVFYISAFFLHANKWSDRGLVYVSVDGLKKLILMLLTLLRLNSLSKESLTSLNFKTFLLLVVAINFHADIFIQGGRF